MFASLPRIAWSWRRTCQVKCGAVNTSGTSPWRTTGSAIAAATALGAGWVQRDVGRFCRIQFRRTTGGADGGTTSSPFVFRSAYLYGSKFDGDFGSPARSAAWARLSFERSDTPK